MMNYHHHHQQVALETVEWLAKAAADDVVASETESKESQPEPQPAAFEAETLGFEGMILHQRSRKRDLSLLLPPRRLYCSLHLLFDATEAPAAIC